ncbi:hypothetical protein WCLP8_1130001 [uncultured Gammaproteobacteria bacterium]
MVDGYTRPFLRSEYSTTITNAHQLQLMGVNLAANYTLANTIDMTELSQASGLWNTATGFVPIGFRDGVFALPFSGTFNGMDHTISGLTIHNTAGDNVGLFSRISFGGTVSNLGLVGGSVTGNSGSTIGELAGSTYGTITNSYATGAVTGGDFSSYIGGLVGYNDGTITGSYATGAVTGGDVSTNIGGLVGVNGGTITSSYATGAVTGGSNSGDIGGLIGINSGAVSSSYATGPVTAGSNSSYGYGGSIGGLIGYNDGTVTSSYATGPVIGGDGVSAIGGLIGVNKRYEQWQYWRADRMERRHGVVELRQRHGDGCDQRQLNRRAGGVEHRHGVVEPCHRNSEQRQRQLYDRWAGGREYRHGVVELRHRGGKRW